MQARASVSEPRHSCPVPERSAGKASRPAYPLRCGFVHAGDAQEAAWRLLVPYPHELRIAPIAGAGSATEVEAELASKANAGGRLTEFAGCVSLHQGTLHGAAFCARGNSFCHQRAAC